jgi:hypothetical protein
MTINDKEVKTTADFSVGLLGIRKLFIVRWSILHHTTPDGPTGFASD